MWRKLTGSSGIAKNKFTHAAGVVVTFLAVMIAWVPFRAASREATAIIWYGMLGFNGIFPASIAECASNTTLAWLFVGLCVIWGMPNSQQWLSNYSPAWDRVSGYSGFTWRPSKLFAITAGFLFALSVLFFTKNSQFLYFQF